MFFLCCKGLCQPILRQQRGGCAQRHIQADSNRCAPNVPPCWSFPTTPGAGDGRKDSLHLGHQVFHLVSQYIRHRNRYTETNFQFLKKFHIADIDNMVAILVNWPWWAGTPPLAMSKVLTTSSPLSSWFSYRFTKFSFFEQLWLNPHFSFAPRTLWKKMLQEWASSSLTLRLVWGKTLRLIRFGAWPRYYIYMCQPLTVG